jgi:hypothetical protein
MISMVMSAMICTLAESDLSRKDCFEFYRKAEARIAAPLESRDGRRQMESRRAGRAGSTPHNQSARRATFGHRRGQTPRKATGPAPGFVPRSRSRFGPAIMIARPRNDKRFRGGCHFGTGVALRSGAGLGGGVAVDVGSLGEFTGVGIASSRFLISFANSRTFFSFAPWLVALTNASVSD